MVCSDVDPTRECLLSVQGQVEGSLQTFMLINGKVKQHRNMFRTEKQKACNTAQSHSRFGRELVTSLMERD